MIFHGTKSKIKFVYTLASVLIAGTNSFCQNSLGSKDTAINKLLDLYHHSSGEYAEIYNGSEYINFASTLHEGQPYFGSDTISTGSILYENIWYEKIPFYYDLVNDELAVLSLSQGFFIRLKSNKVQEFYTKGHHFIRIDKNLNDGNSVSPGFYDQLYGGKLTVLVKREKLIEEYIPDKEIQRRIRPRNFYYLKKEGHYYPVNKQKSVLSALKDKKSELRQFIKLNKKNFKKDYEYALAKISAYYDQITH